MGQKIITVDAFTAEPFKGNPAAVCVMDKAADERWMQLVAREMNLSETAFLYPTGESYHLRWFTPAAEVELCGHATLATAHVMYTEHGCDRSKPVYFDTKSGRLTASLDGDYIVLDFPARGVVEEPLPDGIAKSIGIEAERGFRVKRDWLVEVKSPEIVENLKPDFTSLKKVDARAVMVTAKGNGKYDFVSRFFAPQMGINEDPVTGAAHCAMTPYWSKKLGKSQMTAYQASERGGELRVTLAGDRVKLAGRAVTVMRGELA